MLESVKSYGKALFVEKGNAFPGQAKLSNIYETVEAEAKAILCTPTFTRASTWQQHKTLWFEFQRP